MKATQKRDRLFTVDLNEGSAKNSVKINGELSGRKGFENRGKKLAILFGIILMIGVLASTVYGGEDLYSYLSEVARGKGDAGLFADLNEGARELNWTSGDDIEFEGNLRLLEIENLQGGPHETSIFLVRNLNSDLYVLSVPDDAFADKSGYYDDLEGLIEDKLVFNVRVVEGEINGEIYSFARFLSRPEQVLLDRVFKNSIVFMLFFVMVGMGLTLTVKDFKLIVKKPKGIFVGASLQWLVMPLVAVLLGRLVGFYEAYPFIFVGMVLITVSPGGVTSNLMTYYAKGDLALSISLTSFSTVLSLIFTPLLLALYCSNVPDVSVPVTLIIQTIIVLVLVPLAVGMGVRGKWPDFAKKATPFFSALGIISLLLLIGAGILSNLDKFADTERYGFMFYVMVFLLTMLGILLGVFVPKIFKVNNYQTRAISLELGLRNASLAMAIALLIQDIMGDFYSSMFVTSAIFGLAMYLAGLLALFIYKHLLPIGEVTDKAESSPDTPKTGAEA